MESIKRKPLPSEEKDMKDCIITESGLNVTLPENPFPLLEEIEPFYKSPYFILLFFQIVIFLIIIISVFK